VPVIKQDNALLRPLDPNGNLYPDRLGANRGDFEALNVINPKPGMAYATWRCLDLRTGKADKRRILHAQRMGYRFPEAGGAHLGDPVTLDHGTNLDGQEHLVFGDLILMECPVERVVERQIENEKVAQEALMGSTNKWREDDGSQSPLTTPDRPIKFVLPGHGISRRENLPADF
jgi:hypothetical protein